MKQFLDFLPLVVFFAFYKIYDIYAATAALIVATAIVLIYSWVRFRKVEKMALITFVLVVVFGGLTLFFHNDEFIKGKYFKSRDYRKTRGFIIEEYFPFIEKYFRLFSIWGRSIIWIESSCSEGAWFF